MFVLTEHARRLLRTSRSSTREMPSVGAAEMGMASRLRRATRVVDGFILIQTERLNDTSKRKGSLRSCMKVTIENSERASGLEVVIPLPSRLALSRGNDALAEP